MSKAVYLSRSHHEKIRRCRMLRPKPSAIGEASHRFAPGLARSPLRGTSNTRHPSHLHYRFALATANFQHSASFALEVRFRSRSPLTLRHREAFRSKRGLSFRVYATLRPIAVPVIARWVWVATNGPIRAICFPAHLALPPLTAVKLSRDVFKSRRRFLSTRKGKRIE